MASGIGWKLLGSGPDRRNRRPHCEPFFKEPLWNRGRGFATIASRKREKGRQECGPDRGDALENKKKNFPCPPMLLADPNRDANLTQKTPRRVPPFGIYLGNLKQAVAATRVALWFCKETHQAGTQVDGNPYINHAQQLPRSRMERRNEGR